MVKSKLSILLTLPILILMSACNSSPQAALPAATSSTTRDITIEVINGNEEGLFEIGEIFTSRHHEGFVIWTHQANFWQPGDEYNAGSLDINVMFDDSQSAEPFVFWSNGIIQNGDNGNGSFLASPMNISVNTSKLPVGQHSMTLQVTNPRGQVFEHTWEFVIKQRSPARLSAPTELIATIEYLLENPYPIPAYFSQASTKPRDLDRFSPIGSGEGLCFVLTRSESLSGAAQWEKISIEVDGKILKDNQFGMESELPSYKHICFTTDFLATGTHLAEVSFILGGQPYSHTWVFEIE